MDYAKESLRLHGEWKGKIEVVATVPVATKDDLSLAYTPGVAQPCLEIQKDVEKSYELTRRHNLCLVVTDGKCGPWSWRYRTGGGYAGYGRKVCTVQCLRCDASAVHQES